MPTDAQIQAAAAAAAEKANGGKFNDPLFYNPEHQKFWRDVVSSALNAPAAATGTSAKQTSKVSLKEVQEFSEHCVYIRSVFLFATRILRNSDESERKILDAIAPRFFDDIGKVFAEFVVNAACRITDSAFDRRGNENFTVELFLNSVPRGSETHKQLDGLCQRMQKLRDIVLPARHKLGAHADRAVIQKGEPLGAASWHEWDDFWAALRDFVRILNEEKTGYPFDIEAAGVMGDAEMLLKALKQSQYFEALLKSEDRAVKDACLKVAMPTS